MKMWEIVKYRKELKKEWNEFVSISRNGTFLFNRDYMEYHSDRYDDFSLLAYRRGKLAALLPANRNKATLYTHQGLTYGGWILPSKGIDTGDVISLWNEWFRHCDDNGIEEVIYKSIPYIYYKMPSDEEKYLLFLGGGRLMCSNISSAIDLTHNPGFNKLQTRHLRHVSSKIKTLKVRAEDRDMVSKFHNLLSECLQTRHGAKAVHSQEEVQLLMERFPQNIHLWIAIDDEEVCGGVLIYLTSMCAHCQYIATNPTGREGNVLSLLFENVINHYTALGIRYFDFGTSNENNGLYLNRGLNRQKTSYGGSGVAYEIWNIDVSSALDSLKANQ